MTDTLNHFPESAQTYAQQARTALQENRYKAAEVYAQLATAAAILEGQETRLPVQTPQEQLQSVTEAHSASETTFPVEQWQSAIDEGKTSPMSDTHHEQAEALRRFQEHRDTMPSPGVIKPATGPIGPKHPSTHGQSFPRITIEHEDGNSVTGSVFDILDVYLAKGWSMTEKTHADLLAWFNARYITEQGRVERAARNTDELADRIHDYLWRHGSQSHAPMGLHHAAELAAQFFEENRIPTTTGTTAARLLSVLEPFQEDLHAVDYRDEGLRTAVKGDYIALIQDLRAQIEHEERGQ